MLIWPSADTSADTSHSSTLRRLGCENQESSSRPSPVRNIVKKSAGPGARLVVRVGVLALQGMVAAWCFEGSSLGCPPYTNSPE